MGGLWVVGLMGARWGEGGGGEGQRVEVGVGGEG